MNSAQPRERRGLLSRLGRSKNSIEIPAEVSSPVPPEVSNSYGLPWETPNDAAIHILTTARTYVAAEFDAGQRLAELELDRCASLLVGVEHAAPHVLLILAEQAADLVIVLNKQWGVYPLDTMDIDDMFGDPLADALVRRLSTCKVAKASGSHLEVQAAGEALNEIGREMEADPHGSADAVVVTAIWIATNMQNVVGLEE